MKQRTRIRRHQLGHHAMLEGLIGFLSGVIALPWLELLDLRAEFVGEIAIHWPERDPLATIFKLEIEAPDERLGGLHRQAFGLDRYVMGVSGAAAQHKLDDVGHTRAGEPDLKLHLVAFHRLIR